MEGVADVDLGRVLGVVVGVAEEVVADVGLGLVLEQPLQPVQPLLHLVDHLVGAAGQGLSVWCVRFRLCTWCGTICTCGLHYCAVVGGPLPAWVWPAGRSCP